MPKEAHDKVIAKGRIADKTNLVSNIFYGKRGILTL